MNRFLLSLLALSVVAPQGFAQSQNGAAPKTVLIHESSNLGKVGSASSTVTPAKGHVGTASKSSSIKTLSQTPTTMAGITHSDHKKAPTGTTPVKRDSSYTTTQTILQFSGVNTPEQKAKLQQQLSSITQGQVTLATPADFKGKETSCTNGVCALVSAEQLTAIKGNLSGISREFGFKLAGTRIHKQFVDPSAKIASGLKAGRRGSHTGAKTTSGGTEQYGTTLVSYTTPSAGYDWIPDNDAITGWDIHNDFDSTIAMTQSNSVEIVSTTWTVGFYHNYPNDLIIDIEYDNGPMGGSTFSSFNAFNHGSVAGTTSYHFDTASGLYILSDTDYSVFQYHDPYARFKAHAWDTIAGDTGYLDYVDFDVYWIDYAEIQSYTGTGSDNSYTEYTDYTLDVNNSVINNSYIDIPTTYTDGWYLYPWTSADCTGSFGMTDYTPAHSYTADYQSVSGPSSFPYTNTHTISVTGIDLFTSGAPTGYYCLWFYADDLNGVHELNEWNNSGIDQTDNTYTFQTPVWIDTAYLDVKNVAAGNGQLVVGPNPAQNSISFKSEVLGNLSVTVTDIAGHQTAVNPQFTGAGYTIDLSNFAAGTYVLSINGKTMVGNQPVHQVSKFVKQ